MQTRDFDFHLPPDQIAQTPAKQRDSSKLLIFERSTETVSHRIFNEWPQVIRRGDLIVFNNSRVIPARLHAFNPETGGKFELLLTEEIAPNEWWALMRPAKRARLGASLVLVDRSGAETLWKAEVTQIGMTGLRRVRFIGPADFTQEMTRLGEIPLPPYINRSPGESHAEDSTRYQTVYAAPPGSVAAPTAGLHFTEAVLENLRAQGALLCFVSLHIGIGTFAPVKVEQLEEHVMHEERYDIGEETARMVNEAKAEGRRVIAVGTTSLRVLESVAATNRGLIRPGSGRTAIFVYPPFRFQIVDALLTNFHLPRSTLLMLVSAFASPGKLCGRAKVLSAYETAIRNGYRFFSYGDAMFIQ